MEDPINLVFYNFIPETFDDEDHFMDGLKVMWNHIIIVEK